MDYKVIGEDMKDGRLEGVVVESKIQFTIPYDWFEFCSNVDMFRHGYLGYWAYGYRVGSGDEEPEEDSEEEESSDEEYDFHAAVLSMDEKPWILVEDESETQSADQKEALATQAEVCFRNNEKLPPGCYVMTRELAIKAFVLRAQKDGPNWFENADGSDYDCAIQTAIFGEVKYG